MTVNKSQSVPVNVVGSSMFGRYPKISLEKTYNMFISDDWLITYAGFKNVLDIFSAGEGRGLFHSIRGDFSIIVISSSVYKVFPSLATQFIGNIDTSSGEVSIDENLSRQIAIVDTQSMWIYNYDNNTLTKQTLMFNSQIITPNYVCYHNTFFLIASSPGTINSQNWYAFEFDTPNTVKLNKQFSLQTKPDEAIAVQRIPGRGNNVIVFGSSVAEVWTQVGDVDNYRRVQSFNIDNGCVSVSTIAGNDTYVCWLAKSENNSPSISWTDGASVNRISTDGIDYLLQTLKRPDKSTAFFFRQDGHLFYQLTFFDPEDNLSLVYDFNTSKFFNLSDENLNYHPARQTAYFNGNIYFVSLNSASLYQMGTEFVSYNYDIENDAQGDVIPRIRICKSIRQEDSSRFRVGKLILWIEQGVTDFVTLGSDNLNNPRVDFSFSKNGNQSFSNIVGKNLNTQGNYINQMTWWRMGQANEFTTQFRFWGMQRFVVYNATLEVY